VLDGWVVYLALYVAGTIAGTLNVLAGGGSFLTLPLMIFLGLPPTVANGTNRIAILVQNVGAVWGFSRHRLVGWGWLAWAAPPALAGSALGTWAAVEVGDDAFRRFLALLMVVVSLWVLWRPIPNPRFNGAPVEPPGRLGRAGLLGAFFAVGFYGGFVQAGIGFLLIAAMTAAGLDLVRGNALKVLVVLAYTPLTLALFAAGGKVVWGIGAALAAGNLTGGLIGVRLTVLKGHEWIKRFVTITVMAFAIRLWFGS
jgi:uncharacterized membrane protein YfcA